MDYAFDWVPVGGAFKFEGDDRTWRVEQQGEAVADDGTNMTGIHSCTPVILVETA